MTIELAARQYVEWKQISNPVAGKRYLNYLSKFAKHTNKELEEVGIGDITTFYSTLSEYKDSTKNYTMTVLRGFFDFYRGENLSKVDPKKIKGPRYNINPYHAVSEEEYNLITDYLDTEALSFASLQQHLLVKFLWETGVRVTELVNIKYKSCVTINDFGCIIKTLKNERQRYIFWSPQTNELLKEFLLQRQMYAGEYLFTTYLGKMSTRCVQRFLADVGGKLSFSFPLSPHCFRHGKAHFMHKHGASVALIQAILGHKSPVSTHRYLQFDNREVEIEARKYLT